jgi:twitching motility protein PilT
VIAQQLLARADGQGRVAAVELLIGTTALANLVREGKTYQIPSLIQTGRREGM